MAYNSKKYYIKTFGCQANEADSERLAAVLESRGYNLAKKIEQAEVVVVNTCSVRESAENRVFGLVNNLTKRGAKVQGCKGTKKPKIILTGCMVGSAKGERRRYTLRQLQLKFPGVDEFKTIDELLGSGKLPPKRKKKTSALVPIMEGCNHFCSYCVVPYARGLEVSRPFKEVITEVKDLAERGYNEVTLLGQNVNSFGKDFEEVRPRRNEVGSQRNFSDLLRELHRIKEIQKISFLTSNPWDLTDDIIEAMALPKVDRYFHLPVQSGDNRILKKMNRHYSAEDYLKLIKKIREKIPDIQIGTDIIVGFPGETRIAFENTVRLCKRAGFVKAYVARYSSRPGTAAAKLKETVSPEEKKRRWRVLDKLINRQ